MAHTPVLLAEVIEVLAPRDDGIYVDGTYGAGGYAEAVLAAAMCIVWAIDRDPQAVAHARAAARPYGGRLKVIAGRFGDMDRLLEDADVTRVDGVALDLGVSSAQLEDPDRGFSFRHDGPLDMRMGSDGGTAADAVNTLSEDDLARVLHACGEERAARRIARAIVAARLRAPILRTGDLADLVRWVVGRRREAIDPATRTFQALRIHVNDELGELARGLAAAEALLAPGGRLAVVSFHSLEDRMVKDFLKLRSGGAPAPSRHLPAPAPSAAPSFRLLGRGAVKPGAAEVTRNPRARSARLRAAERTTAMPWPAVAGGSA